MPRVGLGELLVIGFVLLVVLSASRMAALGNALGKFVYSFRKAAKGDGFVDARGRQLPRSGPAVDAETTPVEQQPAHPPAPPHRH
jgi:sec-independent protein translocase protein TatA